MNRIFSTKKKIHLFKVISQEYFPSRYSPVNVKLCILCTGLYSFVQLCTALYSFVQLCTALYSFVQLCTALYNFVQLCNCSQLTCILQCVHFTCYDARVLNSQLTCILQCVHFSCHDARVLNVSTCVHLSLMRVKHT